MDASCNSHRSALLSTRDVLRLIDRRSRSTLWRQVRRGQFPKPTVRIADRYPYWAEEAVSAFLRGEWVAEGLT